MFAQVRMGCMAALVAAAALSPAKADDLKKNTSLAFVPANVGFYSHMQRGGEWYHSMVNSRAFARLKNMPAVQMGWDYVTQQWEGDGEFAAVRKWYEQPENAELVSLLGDGVAHEWFVYGDPHWGDLAALFQEINNESRVAQAANPENPQEAANRILALLAKNRERLRFEPFVMGFKITNKPAAERQIARLEKLLRESIPDEGPWKNRVRREKVGGGDYLSLHLDGSQVPWEEIPLDAFGGDKDDLEQLIQHLSKQTISLSLGLRGDYLLLSQAATTDHLATLGQGKLLVDLPEMAPVLKHQNQVIQTVSYISAEYMRKVTSAQTSQLSQFAAGIDQGLAAGGADEALREELQEDISQLQEAIAAEETPDMSIAGVEFSSPRGLETYTYVTRTDGEVEPGTPLPVVNHVGGAPLMFVCGRNALTIEDYDALSFFGERAFYYLEQMALPNLEGDAEENYTKARDSLKPLAKQLHETMRSKIVPALADGQLALVIDAQTRTRQLHASMPAAKAELPIPELAIVFGVSDAAKLEAGAGEVHGLVARALTALHEALPDDVPDLKLAAPKTETTPTGKIAWHALPGEWGLDAQLAPAAGVSAKFAAVSTSPGQVKRVLEERPFKLQGALANSPGKLHGVGHLNFAALVNTVEPWVMYGIDTFGESQVAEGDVPDPLSQQLIKTQVKTGLEVLRCFKSITSVSYVEDGRLVTHGELHFEDLK